MFWPVVLLCYVRQGIGISLGYLKLGLFKFISRSNSTKNWIGLLKYFKVCHHEGIDLKFISIETHIPIHSLMCWHYTKKEVQLFKSSDCLPPSWAWMASDTTRLEESEHMSRHFRLNIEHVNICRAFPIFASASLSGYLSAITMVPPSSLGYKNMPIFSHGCITLVSPNLT